MAVTGTHHPEPGSRPTDVAPAEDPAGAAGGEVPRPDRQRVLTLVAPVVVVVLVVVAGAVGYRMGGADQSSPGPEATTANTLKAQPIDVGFAADMYDHHEQAVQMSLLVMDKTTNPGVRAHAVQIAVGQRRESGLFQQFLLDRGIEFSDPRRTVMAWMGEPTPAEQMPGLASAEELVALNAAQGTDADRLFLDLMIRHHEGGIHMAEFASANAETQSMRDLAARIELAQRREVNDLAQLRAELDP